MSLQVFMLWTGGQGAFKAVIKVFDQDGSQILDSVTDFDLPNTTHRHYILNVLIIPAKAGIYTITVGREDMDLLRQDFTIEVASSAGSAL